MVIPVVCTTLVPKLNYKGIYSPEFPEISLLQYFCCLIYCATSLTRTFHNVPHSPKGDRDPCSLSKLVRLRALSSRNPRHAPDA